MFYAKVDNNKASEPVSFTVRVRGYGSSAGQMAAQGITGAAQMAAAGVGKGVRQGVYVTRVWAAPRLESAADYTTATMAPKVSSALRFTARQVRPEDAQKTSRSVLTWSALAAAVLATAGAVAALVTYKSRTSTPSNAEEEFGQAGAAGAESATAGAEGSAEASPGAADSASTEAGVNGRVSTSGW